MSAPTVWRADVRLATGRFAHLTRTFLQIIGTKPSLQVRGDFFEIPSPFTSA